MDSCHIFNFIFGTKKATTELSRCFSNIGENVPRTRARSSSQRSSSSHKEGPPKSPLKQLQSRLTTFVSKVHKPHNNDEEQISAPATVATATSQATLQAPLDREPELVCEQSGTYKATLVRSLSDEYEEQPVAEASSSVERMITHERNTKDEISDTSLAQYDDDELCQLRKVATPLNKEDKQAIVHYDGPKDEVKDDNNNNSSNSNIDNDKQATFRADRIVSLDKDLGNREGPAHVLTDINDKRSLYVRNLVRSIESGSINQEQSSRRSFDSYNETKNNDNLTTVVGELKESIRNPGNRRESFGNVTLIQSSKPMTVVKPLPPKAPPKSFKAKCIRHQLSLSKPTKLQQLFQDEKFLAKFFDSLEPLERCAAAQVCRKWRDTLYSDHKYWKGLMSVIDCTQLRREHLVECILNALQSAKMKQQYKLHDITLSSACKLVKKSTSQQSGSVAATCFELPSNSVAESELVNDDSTIGGESKKPNLTSETIFGFDHEDVWRIQEICNRFALQKHNHTVFKPQSDIGNGGLQTSSEQQQQQQQPQQICSASKSSSIPSQISSTFSSASLSSILSPLSESSRVETMKEKLYTSIDSRGFDAICLFGATDDDIEDLVCKIPSSSHERITIGRLNNCSITNRGLGRFITSFHSISELELTGCNELTNAFDLSPLTGLKRLIITDCINIADGLAQKMIQVLCRLTDLTIQAYHLTDAFIEFLSTNCDTSRLKRLELPNCKEITNQSVIVIAKHFPQLEVLSVSGSTKISDDGIEILAERATKLRSLDLSWCPRITDASLECIACELRDSLTDLILDRNVNITDIGLGYLTSMNELSSLQIRWCTRVSDAGIESLFGLRSLRQLSLAGLHQITARSLLGLVDTNLVELELTNCPAVNEDLVMFLSTKLPNCNIIF